MINDMYQESIQKLEVIIEQKDAVIQEHLVTIGKLTTNTKSDIGDLKLVFLEK